MPFNSFGLHPDLVRAVKDLGFLQPTPIQKDAMPPALLGRDVLACAATGSGKTAAFGLPILQRLLGKPRGKTRVLILTPTRELCAQIDEHLADLARHTSVTSAAVYGGVGFGPQQKAMEGGVDIVVATPGRLLDHFRYPYARLQNLEVLVIDEADRMLDMGFLPDIHRILQRVPERRQTLFYSATLPPPIVGLTRELLKNPVQINIVRQARPAAGITHSIYPVSQSLKSALLVEIVKGKDIRNALVFTRTKRRADRVADYLKRCGVSVARIHGDRSQAQRTQAMEGFKRGRYRVLVATDVAARGIDIDALSHVINYDLPGGPDDYVHRVGRTARAEATGDAFTFVTPEEERDLQDIERALTCRIPRIVLPGFDYTVIESSFASSSGERGRHQRSGGNSGKWRGQRNAQRRGSGEASQSSSGRPWERTNWEPSHAGQTAAN